MRSSKLAVTVAALALGTAISTLPAFAQNYPIGRNANDGGAISAQTPASGQNTGSASNEQSRTPMGNNYAFGSQGQPPGRGVYNSAESTPSQFKYPTGRNANDGGMASAQLDQGAQKTGSASNQEAQKSNSDTYMFGAQGQPPRTAR